ncbi:hypothetical protein CR513_32545, partial [Mucuna pruriens]
METLKHSRKDSEQALLAILWPYRSQPACWKLDPGRRSTHQAKSRVEKYTPLKATRAQILKKVYHLQLLNISPPTIRQLGPSREEWCKFHRAHGHTIEECRYVRRKENEKRLEKTPTRRIGVKPQAKIKIGNRTNWIAIIKVDQSLGPPYRGTIAIIIERILRKMSATDQKQYARSERPPQIQDPSITFTTEDYNNTVPHSNDPMVISLIIAEYRVERVLVDQGSSENVLLWLAFQKLDFSKSRLEEYPRTLISFVGEWVEIQGVINLETIVGAGLMAKRMRIRFTVVNTPTSYNVILD